MNVRRLLEGKLEAFMETGTEGVIWSMVDDEGVVQHLSRGDHLVIFDDKNDVFWKGDIDYDWKVGRQPYPFNPKLGQQAACGLWVHGIQQGFEPDAWAVLFLNKRRCLLTKKSSAAYWDNYSREEMPLE